MQMYRLIWVFIDRTCPEVHFLMFWVNCITNFYLLIYCTKKAHNFAFFTQVPVECVVGNHDRKSISIKALVLNFLLRENLGSIADWRYTGFHKYNGPQCTGSTVFRKLLFLSLRKSLNCNHLPLIFSWRKKEKILILFSWKSFFFVVVCVEVLRPSQPNGVMLSAVSLPNHTFTGQA